MKTFRAVCLLSCSFCFGLEAQDVAARAFDLESKGDAAAAVELLQKAVQASPQDTSALSAYGAFLDRHRDPAARETYEKLLNLLPQTSGTNAQRARVARRLVLLDLLADDRAAAARHLDAYRAAGGTDLALPTQEPATPAAKDFIEIPGPLRSFSRMAALSPDLKPEDLLGAFARNVVTNGYQAMSSNEGLDQTEYMKLVVRYLSQARELDRLAGQDKVIRIETCESTQTGDLLRVLGYRMRGGCGSDVVLETVNATRAFLTIDSGFPLAQLEQSLRTSRPFAYDFHPARIPVLYGPEYWASVKERQNQEFIDYFLSDPSLCRLYLGMSKLDPETADELRKAVPVQRIRAFAHVLDFFGAMFEIRNGKAIVPGGARSEKAWADLAGVGPEKGAQFFERLISKDDGWMASYFDALARINGPTKDYLTEPERMKRFYAAIRGKVTSPGPARPVFRSNTDMMLLTTRLRLDANGRPHVPGNLDVWRNLFANHPAGKYDAKLSKSAGAWKDPDDVLEALFGLCRKVVENEPLRIFMALSDIDRSRPKPLDAATIDRLARDYHTLGSQYPIFSEVPTISDKTISDYLDTAHAINQVRDQLLRADTAGTMQALVSAWQIFCRQGSIPAADADGTLSGLLGQFAKINNPRELFDAGRSGVKVLLTATHSPANASPQDRMIDLLAGASQPNKSEAHNQVVQDMIRVFESQRLVSLSTLFELADNLENVAKGAKPNTQLLNRLAARISDIQLPQASLTGVEKNALSYGYYTEKHVDNQRKMNLRAAIDKAAADPEKLKDLRGTLAPILRDTLVGLSYAHYAPPGAQILFTNPLFVRSHDFLGIQGTNQTWHGTELFGSGWPANGGGRLVGSLSGLPYALAEAEQNFLVPTKEQALIWGDLVPQMIVSAVLPRWWNVTPEQQHWVGVHMAYAESLLAEAALNGDRRRQLIEVLDHYAPPARVSKVEELLKTAQVRLAMENIMPSEMFLVAAGVAPSDQWAPLASEIAGLAKAHSDLSYQAISRAFGTPKPTLANTYRPELLNLRTFPTLMGYSSRILAESWESSLLYYAALSDQLYLPPSQLNVVVPDWTRQTIEKIFATHLEDWPALLRSLRLVGDDVRQKARKQLAQNIHGDN